MDTRHGGGQPQSGEARDGDDQPHDGQTRDGDDQPHGGETRDGDDQPSRRRADLPAADREALRRLVEDGVLSPAQAEAVTGALTGSRRARARRRWLAEAAGYTGGALVLGGLLALQAVSWVRLSDSDRFVLLLMTALILASAGLVTARGGTGLRDLRRHGVSARRRLVGVLFAASSWAAAGMAAVAVDRYASVAGFGVGLLVALAGYALLPTGFGLLVSAGFSALLVVAGTGELGVHAVVGALMLSATGVVWTGLAAAGPVTPRAAGLGTGAVVALAGAQWLVVAADATAWGYLLTAALAAGCLALYRSLAQQVLLALGVVAAGIVATELVWELTDGSAAAAAILLVVGLALVAVSVAGLNLRRQA